MQAQVLKLLRRLRDDIGCSIVLITHDLGVAAQISDRIAVLYAGRIAEVGPPPRCCRSPPPLRPTHGLLRAPATLETLARPSIGSPRWPASVPSPVYATAGLRLRTPVCAVRPRMHPHPTGTHGRRAKSHQRLHSCLPSR